MYTMKSLGLPDICIAPISVSEPFPLFSAEAVEIMRKEGKHFGCCDLVPFQLRGYASKYTTLVYIIDVGLIAFRHAKFTFEAWTYPDVTRLVFEIAGVDLVHNIEFEIGHDNVSIPGKKLDHEISSSKTKMQLLVGARTAIHSSAFSC